MSNEQYCCYRYIDADGVIAYIGRTKNLAQRIRQHKTYMEIPNATIEYTKCDDYRDSVDLELFLIKKYKPYLNSKVLNNRYIYHNLIWEEWNS